jgi:hypothetical protein
MASLTRVAWVRVALIDGTTTEDLIMPTSRGTRPVASPGRSGRACRNARSHRTRSLCPMVALPCFTPAPPAPRRMPTGRCAFSMAAGEIVSGEIVMEKFPGCSGRPNRRI